MRRETAQGYLMPAQRGLGAGKPQHVSRREFSRERRFVDVRSMAFLREQFVERNTELVQQFAPARAARSEVDAALSVCHNADERAGRILAAEHKDEGGRMKDE